MYVRAKPLQGLNHDRKICGKYSIEGEHEGVGAAEIWPRLDGHIVQRVGEKVDFGDNGRVIFSQFVQDSRFYLQHELGSHSLLMNVAICVEKNSSPVARSQHKGFLNMHMSHVHTLPDEVIDAISERDKGVHQISQSPFDEIKEKDHAHEENETDAEQDEWAESLVGVVHAPL